MSPRAIPYVAQTTTDTHVMSALKDKRARIDGEIQMRRFQIMRLEIELAHVDAVIRMFHPGFDPSQIATKRTIKRSGAGTVRGSGTREALTILRQTGEALTSREIANRILVKHGRQPGGEDSDRLANTIHASLSRRKDGAITLDASAYPGKWCITESSN